MRFLALALSVFTSFAFAQNKPLETIYKVNSGSSSITWLGKKVTGEHTGKLSLSEGKLIFLGDDLVGGEFTVDMNSLTCTDITDAGMNEKFLGHMKSDDFFSVAKHPTSKLVFKKVKRSGDKYSVNASLTIKGKTQPVSFDVTLNKKTDSLKGSTEFSFDRTKWNLKYGSGKFFKGLGDKMIYDDIKLNVDLKASI